VFYLRKISFCIDDVAYIRNTLIRENNLTHAQIADVLKDYDGFNVTFTLQGEAEICNDYEIIDENNNSLSLSEFTDYQQEFFIECMNYWYGTTESPIGVIHIAESMCI